MMNLSSPRLPPLGSSRSVVVVGGGIAGLSAAYYLNRTTPEREVVLVEAERRLGGKIRTDRAGDLLIEGGPDSFLSSKPAGLELCRDLGLEGSLVGPDEREKRSFVLWDGKLHQIPEGLSGLVPARVEPLLASDLFSAEGKERLRQEPSIPRAPERSDETLAAFVERRFGREMYDRLVEPLMAGIYAGDGEELGLAATFPQLLRLEREHGSVMQGVRRSQSTRPEAALPGFLTPRGGMGDIVTALQQQLTRTRLLTGSPVTSVVRGDPGYSVRLANGSLLTARSLILATPAHVTAGLVRDLDPCLSQLLHRLRHVSTATVSLAYLRSAVAHPLHGYGFVVPRAEGSPVLACTWVSSKFPDRAPPDRVLLRAFVGRRGQEAVLDRPDGDLVQLVRAHLGEVLGITAQPAFQRVHRWPRAMPQYEVGHLEWVARVDELLAAHNGLFVAGAAYRGVGIPDCIRSGRAAAAAAS